MTYKVSSGTLSLYSLTYPVGFGLDLFIYLFVKPRKTRIKTKQYKIE